MPCAVGPPVEPNLMQWLIADDPHRSPVAWNAAPPNLDILVQTNAFFRA